MRRAGALVSCLLLLAGCVSSPTTEQKATAIQTALDAGKAACLILLSDRTIPREPGVEAYCVVLLQGCPATQE